MREETTNRPTDQAAEPQLIIFVRDLLFASKVVATARAEGVAFRAVRDVSKLLNTNGKRLIVDLNAPESLDAAIQWKEKFAGQVIGFVAHVDRERIAKAQAAGIGRVMTNGAFSASLPELIRED